MKKQEATRLAQSLAPSIGALCALTPQQFENEVAKMFRFLKFRVEQTSYVNDSGRDAILYKDGKRYLVECKRYRKDNSVGRPEIQKFHSAIMVESDSKGIFITTSSYTLGAIQYVKEKNLPIRLVDGENLLRLMLQSRGGVQSDEYVSLCVNCGERVRHSLGSPRDEQCVNGHTVVPTLTVEDVLAGLGAYPRPSCVRCGTPMRLVNGRRGKFWGCSRYPQCRSTRRYPS